MPLAWGTAGQRPEQSSDLSTVQGRGLRGWTWGTKGGDRGQEATPSVVHGHQVVQSQKGPRAGSVFMRSPWLPCEIQV